MNLNLADFFYYYSHPIHNNLQVLQNYRPEPICNKSVSNIVHKEHLLLKWNSHCSCQFVCLINCCVKCAKEVKHKIYWLKHLAHSSRNAKCMSIRCVFFSVWNSQNAVTACTFSCWLKYKPSYILPADPKSQSKHAMSPRVWVWCVCMCIFSVALVVCNRTKCIVWSCWRVDGWQTAGNRRFTQRDREC